MDTIEKKDRYGRTIYYEDNKRIMETIYYGTRYSTNATVTQIFTFKNSDWLDYDDVPEKMVASIKMLYTANHIPIKDKVLAIEKKAIRKDRTKLLRRVEWKRDINYNIVEFNDNEGNWWHREHFNFDNPIVIIEDILKDFGVLLGQTGFSDISRKSPVEFVV
jgi:hypothetical protein